MVGRAARTRSSTPVPRAGDVAAVSVAGQQHGMVVLDAHDRVVRPAKLWNDTESAADAQWLVAQLAEAGAGGEAAWADGVRLRARGRLHDHQALVAAPPRARRVGARRARLPSARLAHVEAHRRARDRPRRRVGHRLLLGRTRRLPARPARDRRRRRRLVGAVSRACLGPTERAGTTRAFGSEAVVAPGTGDNMAAAIALGLASGRRRGLPRHVGHRVHGERVADRRRVRRGRRLRRRDRPLPAARVHAERHEGHRRGRRAGCRPVTPRLDALALAAPPGAGGVVVVPYFDGERTPNRPDASGAIARAANDDHA